MSSGCETSMTVSVERLRLYGYHGVMDQERRVGNLFEVSVSVGLSNPGAGSDDSLDSTVSYADLIDLVSGVMSEPSQLLEHVAWQIRRAIGARFGTAVRGGSVTVAKLTPPCGAELASASVTLKWD